MGVTSCRGRKGTKDSGDIKAAPRAEFAERPQAVLPALGSLLAMSSSLTWLPVPPEGSALDSGLVLGDSAGAENGHMQEKHASSMSFEFLLHPGHPCFCSKRGRLNLSALGAALRKAALRATVGSWPECPDDRKQCRGILTTE